MTQSVFNFEKVASDLCKAIRHHLRDPELTSEDRKRFLEELSKLLETLKTKA